ncbi:MULTISPECIES: thiamine ABC transporter substrate-binding protein [Streptomyces]|uniref:Thiamine ABC transporter substrate-binding protein n=1 Tax=Streptomyces caniscabiei TaxID=2746961 RepID=A0ABU4MPL8_9ACTN|nr:MULTISPECIES: thiamine ABC transporter substrate-binding protein [Streptomyces]MBE4735791.1 thiamine ABC transporter substrate-binding protein [Streptomyces caniscabiei]MBE4758408.1 thiamine ABC transporter substrate-binding protein [Streptomyces caniscabiei]MBE4774152.1 thiamine ABC transporter substrate-binding protein [Streptomyces caniscabiei]MBE4788499.1 thiamine ABC transporter substrate-binding protein [Streptomyces caniscabiei]MBE4796207.1 thiamine ABC transporter substrate-binding 
MNPVGITITRRATVLAVGLGLVTLSACGSSGDDAGSGGSGGSKTVTLVSHGSFAYSKDVLKAFEKESGYQVKVLKSGDAGQAVNQAILTKDNPQGDVFFGVDNTLLSRALDNGLFQPYEAKGLDKVGAEYQLDKDEHRVTPIDSGDICVNYDKAYFAEKKIEPPRTYADLIKPEYKDLLVTENASTSSPGLGFLLGSAAEFGDDGWEGYWGKLKANGVKVVDGWEQAYYQEFSGSTDGKKAGGDRPLVVSYASSPPAEVVYAKPRPKTAPTGVAEGTCFRQIEFAGLLSNAKNAEGGKALIDFLISKRFQEDMPLNMFVYPVVEGASVPAEFTEYGPAAKDPETMAPEKIAENRDQWVKSWTSLVLK